MRSRHTKTYPGQMLDANLAVDEKKLDYVARVASGQEAVLELVRRGGSLELRSYAVVALGFARLIAERGQAP